MGLSSYPSPSEGVLTLVLMNTALSVAIFKEILRSILHVVGIRSWSSSQPSDPAALVTSAASASPAERFRNRNRPVRFGKGGRERDCRVCLGRFEPESVVDRLTCGHVFHRGCLERWMEYWHVTCPLCRSPVMAAEGEAEGEEGNLRDCPWF
ncbi:putative E3 ubiquitin-protein ligase RHA2B [Acorus calamus]|uniref:E3 ubiquitin-protein ligase RHA2B n=1 Tax=Acorus calamus TaxID=4465 RepID=A0AAV9D687_ACOCL|nr:putative E3 ubiquitin-protein ligase RHA2B [Acorus calamus]